MKQHSSNIFSQQGLGHVQLITIVAVITLTMLIFGGVAQVEGGCSRFGHSCFGAHCKRADFGNDLNGMESLPSNDDIYYPVVPPTVPAQQQPVYSRLSPYLLDWLLSVRRDQDLKSRQDQLGSGSMVAAVAGATRK